MTFGTFWHVGILVYDLEAAIARFSDLLGLHFNRVDADADLIGDAGSVTPVHVDAAFSVEGPPFYELLQAQNGGVRGGITVKACTTSGCGNRGLRRSSTSCARSTRAPRRCCATRRRGCSLI